MANKNLTGQTIASSYDQLLLSADENGVTGQTSSATQIICGTGTAGAGNTGTTPLYLSRDRVGIGTTSPESLLSLFYDEGTAYANTTDHTGNAGLLITNDDQGTLHGATAGIGFRINSGTENKHARAYIGAVMPDDANDGTNIVFQIRTPSDTFITPLFVENSGNIGIGTTAPDSPLSIETASAMAVNIDNWSNSQTTPATINLRKNKGTNFSTDASVADDTQLGAIYFQGMNVTGTNDYETGAYIMARVNGSAATQDNDMPTELIFATSQENSQSGVPNLVISSNGSVGIGTATPDVLLDLHGTQLTNDGAAASNENILMLERADNSPTQKARVSFGVQKWAVTNDGRTQLNFGLWHDTGEVTPMSIRSNGNVGIGTTDPQSLLNVVSTSGAEVRIGRNSAISSGNSLGSLTFNAPGEGTNNKGIAAQISAIATANFQDQSNAYNPTALAFSTAKVSGDANNALEERMRIDNNGRVGIGTNEPVSHLHMKAGYGHIIDIVNSTNPTYTISWTSADYNRIIVMIDVIGNDATTGGDPKGMRISFSLEGDNFNPTNGVNLLNPSDATDGVALGAADDGGGLLFFECWGSDMDNYSSTATNELGFTAAIARSTNDCVATLNFTDWAQTVGRMTVSSNVAAIVAKTA